MPRAYSTWPWVPAPSHAPTLEPGTLAVVPGVGVAVWGSHLGGHLHFFATTRDVAMASLSDVRVGWMVAVARSALARYSGPW